MQDYRYLSRFKLICHSRQIHEYHGTTFIKLHDAVTERTFYTTKTKRLWFLIQVV